MNEFEKIVWVSPAFDKRSNDPGKDYGIGSCRITFILKGPLGATQFMIGTNWYVPSAREHLMRFDHARRDNQNMKPDGWDVGYHSPKPMYEGQTPMDHCDVLDVPCYYDGSGLLAEEWIEGFVAGGTNWLWPKLEQVYRNQFETTGDREPEPSAA